jgi:hypothetical protein
MARPRSKARRSAATILDDIERRSRRMLTVFSIPKPFQGELLGIQMRSVRSWLALGARVILFGDDPEMAAATRGLDLAVYPELTRNERGTPFLDSVFARAMRELEGGACCFVNADVILTEDVLQAQSAVAARFSRYLLVGQTRDLAVEDRELNDLDALRARAELQGTPRGPTAIDWFVFHGDFFSGMPRFLVGRAAFDNWFIWRARQTAVVVDATRAVVAIHQTHDYTHLAGGKDEAYYGPEAQYNRRLAGGSGHIYTLHDASHRLRDDLTVAPNLGATLRARERLRKVGWKLGIR